MGTAIELELERQSWPIAGSFRISRGAKTNADVIVVTLRQNGFVGLGECVPYARYGETMDSVATQIEQLKPALNGGLNQQELQDILPAGAARNAVDCAFWDLQCQQSSQPAWKLAKVSQPLTLTTAFTLSLGSPLQMIRAAKQAKNYPLLKIKLAGDKTDIERLQAISSVRPDAALILDGNEGFNGETLGLLLAAIKSLNIAAIEQPLPTNADQALANIKTDFAFCADESFHTIDDLARIASLYQMINIKLDKTGGLTQALQVKTRARELGLKIMVGCMVATSLSMAPALLLANDAELIDLDGPLLLAKDRQNGLLYQDAKIIAARQKIWGHNIDFSKN